MGDGFALKLGHVSLAPSWRCVKNIGHQRPKLKSLSNEKALACFIQAVGCMATRRDEDTTKCYSKVIRYHVTIATNQQSLISASDLASDETVKTPLRYLQLVNRPV